MRLWLVWGQTAERFVILPAKVASVRDSGDVARLYVLPHISPSSFLSTDLAYACQTQVWQVHCALCHHRLDPLVQTSLFCLASFALFCVDFKVILQASSLFQYFSTNITWVRTLGGNRSTKISSCSLFLLWLFQYLDFFIFTLLSNFCIAFIFITIHNFSYCLLFVLFWIPELHLVTTFVSSCGVLDK